MYLILSNTLHPALSGRVWAKLQEAMALIFCTTLHQSHKPSLINLKGGEASAPAVPVACNCELGSHLAEWMAFLW